MASPTPDRKQSTKHEETKESSHSNHAHDSRLSPKRRTSEFTHENNGESGKKKRRKVNHACVYCRRSHMTCDLERPCARCIKRDIGHLCHDEPRDPPKRSKSEVGVPEIAPAPGEGAEGKHELPPRSQSYTQANGDMRVVDGGASTAGPTPMSPPQLQGATVPTSTTSNGNGFSQHYDWNNNGVHNQFQDMHHLHPNYMFNTSEATNEYNLLNEFLSSSLLDDGAIYGDDTQALFSDPLLGTPSMNAALAMNLTNASNNANNHTHPSSALHPPPQAAGNDISRPPSTFPIDARAREKFYMTAADPAGLSSAEDRLHKLFRAKYDAGMLKPFNYVRGYARLSDYISAHLSRNSQLRILKQLDRFRPKFREAMQTLTDMQLVLVEMRFEHALMEYDRVLGSMAIPACCWRRTGEIFRGNTEMADLIGCPLEDLRDGKLAIHEIVAEDSLVSYWEKFGAIAFDTSQKAILTSCSLMLPEARAANAATRRGQQQQQAGRNAGVNEERPRSRGHQQGNGEVKAAAPATVKCCFSFTIRRDSHNIPSLIVGNFLPMQPRPS